MMAFFRPVSVPPAPTMEEYRQRAVASDRPSGGTRSRDWQPGLPVMTIVTIVRNMVDTLPQCIESVARQTYPNIEYIIADGQSTDGSIELLKETEGNISLWFSERDVDRADATNKAVACATGDYITFLPADDSLPLDFVAASVAAFTRSGADFVFGDLELYSDSGKYLYRKAGTPDYAAGIRCRFTITAPSFSVSRRMLEQIGLFRSAVSNTLTAYAEDYEIFLRAHCAGFRGAYDPAIRYYFRAGGVSSTSAFPIYQWQARWAILHGANPLAAWGWCVRITLRHLIRDGLSKLLPNRVMLALRRLRRRLVTGPT